MTDISPVSVPGSMEQKAAERGTTEQKYRTLTLLLIKKGLTISTMESCTGGLLASLLTDTEGSSAAFRGSYVTYSNAEKIRLGVPAQIIKSYGVYSPQTANAMAQVCAKAFGTDIGIGVTGTFTNADPANSDSVPGEVFFSIYGNAINGNGRPRDCNCTVPALPSRHACKLRVADMIADRLLEILR